MVWEPENEALLKSLRLRAGMDIATLARRNIVSTAQVRQLEDGGNSSFYSPEIKYAVGKKLLQSLGHDLKIEVPLTVQAIVENDPSQTARCSNTVKIPLQDSTINLPNKHLFKTSSVVFLLLASCVLASTAALFWFNKSKTEPVQVTLHGPIEVKAEFQAQVKDTTELEKTEISQPATQAACLWNNAEEDVQPDAPQKVAEYVHLVAQQNTTVCIMDGQKQVVTLNLSVGDARSIYGTPPFKVYSADLKTFKIYFQGRHIKLANEDTQQIKLTPAPYIPLKN